MHVCSSIFELSSAFLSPSLCLILLLPLRIALSPTLKYYLDNPAWLIRYDIWNLMKHLLLYCKFGLSYDKPYPSLTSVNVYLWLPYAILISITTNDLSLIICYPIVLQHLSIIFSLLSYAKFWLLRFGSNLLSTLQL